MGQKNHQKIQFKFPQDNAVARGWGRGWGWGSDTKVVGWLAPSILEKVLDNVQNATMYTVMADESIDIPNIYNK